MNSSTRGLGHKSSFVETNIYTGHIFITPFIMINACLSKKLVLKIVLKIVCYESPRPTVGIHRFAFVLFCQLGRQTVYALGWRQNFNTKDFAELYNFGSPVAAVYFNCQRESSGGRRR